MRKWLKIKVFLTSPFILPYLRTRWFWKVEHHFGTTNFFQNISQLSIPFLYELELIGFISNVSEFNGYGY